MKKTVISEINEIKKMMKLINEEETENPCLPIDNIRNGRFNYHIVEKARGPSQLLLTGSLDGKRITPIVYDVTGYHPVMGNFDVIIGWAHAQKGYKGGDLRAAVKPDSWKWPGVSLAIPSENLDEDGFLLIHAYPAKVKEMLRTLASNGGRNATMEFDYGVKLHLTKNREFAEC